MSTLEKIERAIQEIGYDYELDGNSIIVKNPTVSFQDANTYFQICGGICPITPNLAPDINRVNQYFEGRNADFPYGRWEMYNGNNRILVNRIFTSDFNSFSKDEIKEFIEICITEFSNENKAVMLDLLSGNI